MATSKKSLAERETIIRRAADEKEWEVFSEDARVIRKLSALYGPGRPKGEGAVWTVPPTGISFRRPRVLGPAERAEAAARFKATLARHNSEA